MSTHPAPGATSSSAGAAVPTGAVQIVPFAPTTISSTSFAMLASSCSSPGAGPVALSAATVPGQPAAAGDGAPALGTGFPELEVGELRADGVRGDRVLE